MEKPKRILFIAPRYHTNFRFQLAKLLEAGNVVRFISIGQGAIENYQVVQPIVIGLSRLGRLLDRYLNPTQDVAQRNVKGLPNVFRLYAEVIRFRPDVVITRSVNSTYFRVLFPLFLLRWFRLVVYVQNPQYVTHCSLTKRIYYFVLTKIFNIRFYTTVRYLMQEGTPSTLQRQSFYSYFPFFIVPQVVASPSNSSEVALRLLHIGKFIPRKNHALVLDAFIELRAQFPNCSLTLIGECVDAPQRELLTALEVKIAAAGCNDAVHIYTNVPNERIAAHYAQANLFLMLSVRETASISQVEAMSFGLPVICSIDNGTAHYIEEGVNGYVILPQKEVLLEKLLYFATHQNEMAAMGKNSLHLIQTTMNIDQNYDSFMQFITSK